MTHDAVEMKLDFTGQDSSQAFDQAIRFVIRFTLAFDVFQRSSRQNSKGALMDDLVAGTQFGNDEMDGGSKAKHVVLMSVFVRTKSGERRQQSVVQVDDAATRKLPAQFSGQYPHESSQHHVVDFIFVDQRFQLTVIRVS